MISCPIYKKNSIINWLLRYFGYYDLNGWKNYPGCSWMFIHYTGWVAWPDSGEGSGCNESA